METWRDPSGFCEVTARHCKIRKSGAPKTLSWWIPDTATKVREQIEVLFDRVVWCGFFGRAGNLDVAKIARFKVSVLASELAMTDSWCWPVLVSCRGCRGAVMWCTMMPDWMLRATKPIVPMVLHGPQVASDGREAAFDMIHTFPSGWSLRPLPQHLSCPVAPVDQGPIHGFGAVLRHQN